MISLFLPYFFCHPKKRSVSLPPLPSPSQAYATRLLMLFGKSSLRGFHCHNNNNNAQLLSPDPDSGSDTTVLDQSSSKQIYKRYHRYLTLVRRAIIKKSTNNKCWRGCGERGTYTTGRNVNRYIHQGEQQPESRSVVADAMTPWTVAHQAPLSKEFSRQEYWSGLPFPSSGDLPEEESNPCLLHCRQILYCLSHQVSPSLYA